MVPEMITPSRARRARNTYVRWGTRMWMAVLLLVLAGCAQKEVNQQIAAQNERNNIAMATALLKAAETDTPVDDVLVALSFALGWGQQPFYRERDGVDYLNAFFPYTGFFFNVFGGGRADNGDKRNLTAGRDIYIESTRSGATMYDIYSSAGGINMSTVEAPEGDVCEGCSFADFTAGLCSCDQPVE